MFHERVSGRPVALFYTLGIGRALSLVYRLVPASDAKDGILPKGGKERAPAEGRSGTSPLNLAPFPPLCEE